VLNLWYCSIQFAKFQDPSIAADHAPWYKRVIASLNKLFAVFANAELRNRLLICHFAWCVTAMTYYALALNADNFTADK
jgi:hypothetical protein